MLFGDLLIICNSFVFISLSRENPPISFVLPYRAGSNCCVVYCFASSDLELAIALQQQEFEQQPRRNLEQPTVSGGSRLVTGPQVGFEIFPLILVSSKFFYKVPKAYPNPLNSCLL